MSYITTQQLEHMKEEKERCKLLYKDWKDNEYNCLDNLFLWGIKSVEDLSDALVSFHTLNDFTLYYNRQFKLYFIEIDLPVALKYSYIGTKVYLEELRKKFEDFLVEYLDEPKESFNQKVLLEELNLTEGFDNFSAHTLKELFIRFSFFVRGFNSQL